MTVKARMTCNRVVQTAPTERWDYSGETPRQTGEIDHHFEVNLAPYMKPADQQTDEDKLFGSATPSGEVRMHICNPSAARYFEPGAEYEIAFTKIGG